ncbi:flagellar hook-length control protein FliK [Vibrio campbellii]|uniref:flagellar hook-length control protein FliK n=1 Tax=Vibrio campbellii TaxID=680 RepID=UPI0002AE2176|nr:flagellar hook-length control protein FliK [Vibrio campbellii]ARV73241.1 flagellar hook-length control protein FliK [Vibrio campbellii CAIM 519 = NBRC 15631 = ATCC 25920]ELU52377.1 flagellar hook-length control protein FliK [Vibrio campbellii CAIM 519 = NBRC 15631 = ATCC 25920]
MNVNLSNVSATNKASVSDSSNKVDAENPESKGFFETLAGVFTDSQKAEKAVAKSDTPDAAAETSEEAGKVVSQNSQGESQEKVAQDTGNATSTESTDELLAQGEGKQATNSSVESSENAASSSNVKASNSSDDTSPSETKVSKADVADQASDSQVKSAMGEGQQLLGRIEQANQTLKPNEQLVDSGKALPPEAAQTQGASQQVKDHVVTSDQQAVSTSVKSVEQGDVLPIRAAEKVTLDANGKPIATAVEVSPNAQTSNVAQSTASTQIDWNSPSSQVAQVLAGTEALQSVLPADAQTTNTEVADVQRISLDELQVIDTKLAQGKPLSQQELDVIEGLKTGELVADIPVQELAQFVALPSDVKVAMAEHQAAHNQTRVAASTVAAQQAHQLVTQDMKHAAAQASAQVAASPNADKAALSAMPEALVAANLNTSAQAASSAELSKKVMNAGLAAGALKGATNKQDKPDPQHGLAGQIQAAAGQQGVTAQQQARVDAAQQAQLPFQLTKELANDQVAEKVQMMMSKNLKNLDIRLDPPELGRMQIRMTMNNDLANVHFTVANPQARDLIEQTLPRLREMLAQQGMQLADSSVQQQSSGQQQSGYANAEQNGQGSQGRGFSGQSDENFDADTNLDLNVVSKRDGISFYA